MRYLSLKAQIRSYKFKAQTRSTEGVRCQKTPEGLMLPLTCAWE